MCHRVHRFATCDRFAGEKSKGASGARTPSFQLHVLSHKSAFLGALSLKCWKDPEYTHTFFFQTL